MKQWQLGALAVVLLVIAVLLIGKQVVKGHGTMVVTPRSAEQQIADVQNDPHIPPAAKENVIAQIRAHAGGGAHPVTILK